jgi:L-lactate dehydrogenase complex protein LldF
MEDFKHLSFASSLCGNCTEVCAVKINLHELLLENRSEAVNSGYVSFGEKTAWKIWKRASLSRSMMNMSNGNIKNRLVNNIFKGWKKHRGELHFSKKTFNELWRERFNG